MGTSPSARSLPPTLPRRPARTTAASFIALAFGLAACAGTAAPRPPTDSAQQKNATLLKVADETRAGGDPATAANLYRQLHDTAPRDPVPLARLGATFVQMQDFREAAEAYRAAVALAPANTDYRRGLALTLLIEGQAEPALTEIRTALATRPDDARLYSALGVAQDMTGQHVLAQQSYRHGIELEPTNIGLRNNYAMSLALAGDYAGAVAGLAPISGPDAAPRYRLNLALAYGLAGDDTKAADMARQVLDEGSVRNNLAYYALLRGMDPEKRTAAILGAELHGTAIAVADTPAAQPRASVAAASLPPLVPASVAAVTPPPPVAVVTPLPTPASVAVSAKPTPHRRVASAVSDHEGSADAADTKPVEAPPPTATSAAAKPADPPIAAAETTSQQPTAMPVKAPADRKPVQLLPPPSQGAATPTPPAAAADATPSAAQAAASQQAAEPSFEAASAAAAAEPAQPAEASTEPQPVARPVDLGASAAPTPTTPDATPAQAASVDRATSTAATTADAAQPAHAPPSATDAAPAATTIAKADPVTPAEPPVNATATGPAAPTVATAESAKLADPPPSAADPSAAPTVAMADSAKPADPPPAATTEPSPAASNAASDDSAPPPAQPTQLASLDIPAPHADGHDAAPTRGAKPGAKPIVEHFAVQLGSYLLESSAQKVSQQLTAGGIAVTTSRATGHDGREWYIVRAGDFDTADAANAQLAAVRSLGDADAVVVRHRVKAEGSTPAA